MASRVANISRGVIYDSSLMLRVHLVHVDVRCSSNLSDIARPCIRPIHYDTSTSEVGGPITCRRLRHI